MNSDPIAAEPGKEERNWAMWAHLCGLLWLFGTGGLIFFPFGSLALFTILGPLIIWKAKGDSLPFAGAQAKEALNFQITVLLAGIASCMLIFILIGFVMLWVLGLLNLIFVIIAAIQVNDGKPYRYPLTLRLIQ
jgi:uncharacterized Tic20 family protein